MKQLLITIAAVVLVGCGPPKAPDISILDAAGHGRIEAVKQHIAAGTDVNAKDILPWTPLHRAAEYGHKQIAELLIVNGADLEAKTPIDEMTPLIGALMGDHTELVELLIKKGADVNAKNNNLETALDEAVKNEHPETADLLRKHGAKTCEKLKAEVK
tara:strand:- start:352 stop:825 length:474 start_codon:yes stop_codon:yes gene_type:complete